MPPPVSEIKIKVNVIVDSDGNWIAFGRSDNTSEESSRVNQLLRRGFLGPVTSQCEVNVTVPLPVPETADVG
jgi:hypothetical protein